MHQIMSLQSRHMLWCFVWSLIFFLPSIIWLSTTELASYIRYGAPIGQIWYLVSKFLALYAALLLWYQVISTLFKNSFFQRLFPDWTFLNHKKIGSLTLIVSLMHAVCFCIAVSLRKQEFALGLFWFDFKDFYHTAISLGLFAFWMVVVSAVVAIFRKRWTKIWYRIHSFLPLFVFLGLIHGYLIGTESRYGVYHYFYMMLMISLVAAVLFRFSMFKKLIHGSFQ